MTDLFCLEKSDARGDVVKAPEPTAALGDQEENWFCCRNCDAPIAPSSALMKSDRGPLVFSNPQGVVFEIVTLSAAQNLKLWGEPTTEATWFSGYAWTVAFCAGCRAHLGWRYDAAVSGVTPASFFGLLRAELVERKSLGD